MATATTSSSYPPPPPYYRLYKDYSKIRPPPRRLRRPSTAPTLSSALPTQLILCFRAWRTKESANCIQNALTLVPSLALKGGSIGASTHQVDLNVTGEIKASKAPVLETTELQSNTAGSANPVLKKNSSCDITVQVQEMLLHLLLLISMKMLLEM